MRPDYRFPPPAELTREDVLKALDLLQRIADALDKIKDKKP